MYTTENIQDMIQEARANKEQFFKHIDSAGISISDKSAIKNVINEGWYEEFDRYDSAVCEHFIDIFEELQAEV